MYATTNRFLRTFATSSLALAMATVTPAAAQQSAGRSPADQRDRELADHHGVDAGNARHSPDADGARRRTERANSPAPAPGSSHEVQATGPILADADRVSWLAARLADAASLNKFAAQRLDDAEVAAFAERTAERLEQQATLARQAALQRSNADWSDRRSNSDDTPDLSETVGEIGEAVRDRLRERAAEKRTADVPADRNQPAPQLEGRDLVRRQTAYRGGSRLESEPAQESSANRRRAARERLGVLLPAVREEMPEMLEMLAEAIEDESVDTAAWVDHQTKVADRVLQAKKDELARHDRQEEFVQAYLGMCLVSAIELQAASDAVAESTDQSLHSLLGRTADLLGRQAEEARELMERQYSPRTGGAAEDQSQQNRTNLAPERTRRPEQQ